MLQKSPLRKRLKTGQQVARRESLSDDLNDSVRSSELQATNDAKNQREDLPNLQHRMQLKISMPRLGYTGSSLIPA